MVDLLQCLIDLIRQILISLIGNPIERAEDEPLGTSIRSLLVAPAQQDECE